MNRSLITLVRQRELVQRINALHAEAEHYRDQCREEVYEALNAARQVGTLLLQQKQRVARGNWILWLETHFQGTERTAQRYMALAKVVPDVSQLRGITLRQAYLRLGVAVATDPHQGQGCRPILPVHARPMNRFHRWLRKHGRSSRYPRAAEAHPAARPAPAL